MTHEVDVQIASDEDDLPDPARLRAWARAAVSGLRDEFELTIRIVDEAEGARLNTCYRNKDGATNVLSFPFDPPEGVDMLLLGDIVICAPVVRREADQQSKSADSHWAHMVVHGSLHLLGYDHMQAHEALKMETLETRILAGLGFDNPYESQATS
jgi:probable rRNA maturation factor